MIKINALYFLLLIELLVIFAGVIAFLVFREKKRVIIYRESKRELETAHTAQEELKKQVAALKSAATKQSAEATYDEMMAPAKAPQAKSGGATDHEACKMEITILEEKLKEKTKLLIDLQEKYDGVEKEYLLLYQQQQAQEKHQN